MNTCVCVYVIKSVCISVVCVLSVCHGCCDLRACEREGVGTARMPRQSPHRDTHRVVCA